MSNDRAMVEGLRIAFGTDEVTAVTQHIQDRLRAAGHDVHDVAAGIDWPDAGRAVGDRVASGAADLGVVCCWTGTGVSIAANKVPGVRAALCGDAPTADGARRWNDANVLALSLRTTSIPLADEIIDAFLTGSVDPADAHLVDRLERGR